MNATAEYRAAHILDDEPSVCDLLADYLRHLGYEPHTYNSVDDMDLSAMQPQDVLFTDLYMPQIDGIEVLRRLADHAVPCGVVLMSGTDARILRSAHLLAKEHGLQVIGKLTKPFRIGDVRQLIEAHQPAETNAPNSASGIDRAVIEEALANRRFIVHYQPKISLQDHSVVGAEALVRLKTAAGEIIPPTEFIAIAEELGMIDDITWQVIDQCVDFIKTMRPSHPDINLAVNISAHTLDDITFPDRLCAHIDEHELPHNMLSLEVTESALAKEYSNALDVLSRLRMRGFDLALDDFGTGFSMLQQLRDMPFTEMKIDRSFIQDMTTGVSRQIVQRCVEMAHDLDMKTIAEGIEDPQSESILKEMGCNLGQGYLYARPLPLDEFTTLLSH